MCLELEMMSAWSSVTTLTLTGDDQSLSIWVFLSWVNLSRSPTHPMAPLWLLGWPSEFALNSQIPILALSNVLANL